MVPISKIFGGSVSFPSKSIPLYEMVNFNNSPLSDQMPSILYHYEKIHIVALVFSAF